MIGREIENPFGDDVNDLPMDAYCREISGDLDVLTSVPYLDYKKFVSSGVNRPLFPISYSTTAEWANHNVEDIREALRAKAATSANNLEKVKSTTTPRVEQV